MRQMKAEEKVEKKIGESEVNETKRWSPVRGDSK